MIDWNKIVESHVVKTFRGICNKWWEMDIQFFDEQGNHRSNGIPFRNPFCGLMHSTASSTRSCLSNYKSCLKEVTLSQRASICECNVGLFSVIVPLYVKEKYVGAMVGSGMLLFGKEPKEKTLIKRAAKFGFDKDTVTQIFNKLKVTNSHSEEYILDFMELVAGDVIAFYEMLQEKDEAVERQTMLLEKAYNEKYKSIIGTSPAMKKIFDTLELVETCESPVLIDGESGTGKELLAAAIHYNSARKDKMFIIQNCSAFTETLLCSELFGHAKGAFTGAIADKKGLFEIANEGTLFLDEIGDMELEIQAKLLRVLESGTYYRVGGTEQEKVDVRVVVATNKDLEEQVERGLFRKDLFYRINTIHVTMPPLRGRKDDIKILANHFLGSYAEMNNVESKIMDKDVIDLLVAHDWPGNVRELKNLTERLIILSGNSKLIESRHFPLESMKSSQKSLFENYYDKDQNLKDILKSLEKEIVEEKLKCSNWNKSAAAKELGISRASLNNKIVELGIKPDTNEVMSQRQ